LASTQKAETTRTFKMNIIKPGTPVWVMYQAENRSGHVTGGKFQSDKFRYEVVLDEPIELRWRPSVVKSIFVCQELVEVKND
jgi:hypothetical protein